jgi:uncharacterized protein YjbI with pentapeptide repeats
MADEKHLELLREGVEIWNKWREGLHLRIIPNLSGADLVGMDLRRANLYQVNLRGANLYGANLREANLAGADLIDANIRKANLSGANLSRATLGGANLIGGVLGEAHLHRANLRGAVLRAAYLIEADLSRADLRGADLQNASLNQAKLLLADLSRADLRWAHLREADLRSAELYKADLSEAYLREAHLGRARLREADLRRAQLCHADLAGADLRGAVLSEADLRGAYLEGADLNGSTLVGTDLQEADLTGCHVYGVSAWDISLEGSSQLNLIITPDDQPTVTVDNLEVAQFIYLLLNNEKIRSVIDTITSKVALILGRFTPERKAILDAIREELRKRDYLPVLFDFDKPASRDLTETVRTLAHLAKFIIADITEPRSIPQELQSIVPDLAVPIQPLLLKGSTGEYGMFESFKKYHWVLSIYEYSDLDGLITSLEEKVIKPAETKAKELANR